MAAANLLPNEFHATANVSLLACLQKLSTTALREHLKLNYLNYDNCRILSFVYFAYTVPYNIGILYLPL